MNATRRTFRLIVLAVIGLSLTACHFHGCGRGWGRGGGFHHHGPVRFCR